MVNVDKYFPVTLSQTFKDATATITINGTVKTLKHIDNTKCSYTTGNPTSYCPNSKRCTSETDKFAMNLIGNISNAWSET